MCGAIGRFARDGCALWAQVMSDELPFGNVISDVRGTPRVMVAPCVSK